MAQAWKSLWLVPSWWQECRSRGGRVGEAGGKSKRAPAPLSARGRTQALVLRAPDERVHIGIGLASSPTEVGVERLGAELRCRDRERDVVPAGHLSLAD